MARWLIITFIRVTFVVTRRGTFRGVIRRGGVMMHIMLKTLLTPMIKLLTGLRKKVWTRKLQLTVIWLFIPRTRCVLMPQRLMIIFTLFVFLMVPSVLLLSQSKRVTFILLMVTRITLRVGPRVMVNLWAVNQMTRRWGLVGELSLKNLPSKIFLIPFHGKG